MRIDTNRNAIAPVLKTNLSTVEQEARRLALVRSQFAEICAKQTPEQYEERFHEALCEFDEFRCHALVVSVGVNTATDGFLFGTKTIYLPDPQGRMRELGVYFCMLTPQGYFVENLVRTVNKKHHPHVSDEGKFCIANSHQINIGLKSGRFAEVGSLLLTALTSLGPKEPFLGASIQSWPHAKKRET